MISFSSLKDKTKQNTKDLSIYTALLDIITSGNVFQVGPRDLT